MSRELIVTGELTFQFIEKDAEGNIIRQVENKVEFGWVTPDECIDTIMGMKRIFLLDRQ